MRVHVHVRVRVHVRVHIHVRVRACYFLVGIDFWFLVGSQGQTDITILLGLTIRGSFGISVVDQI